MFSFMASEGEEKLQEGGLGKVGKFMKRRFSRQLPAKPYDRPPTARRLSGSNSWILRLVDPAHRLIYSGAQMLFSFVFREYLPHRLTSRTSLQGDNPSNRCDQFGMMELEKILKQKTFTRSEIDHLKTLLYSRTIDFPVVGEEKRSELILIMPKSNNRKEEFVKLPAPEVGMGSQSISSTLILSSNVLDEDIASPAEIARAYMGSRLPKVFPSIPSLQAHAFRENSAVLCSTSFPSKSNNMFLEPISTGHEGIPDNGFVTPKSQSRSALYSMARLPHSKVHTKFRGKDRSSFLDNDFKFVGPSRSTHRKHNIFPLKGLNLPVSAARPLIIPVNGLCSKAGQSSKFCKVNNFPSSIRKAQLSIKPKKIFSRKLITNMDGDDIHGPSASFISTHSRSLELASKILDQLAKLTPPMEKAFKFKQLMVGEKSPPKLSPSMSHGMPRRSLEDVDLSRSEGNVDDNKWSGSLSRIPFYDDRNHTLLKQENLEIMKSVDPYHRFTALVNGSGSTGSGMDSMAGAGVSASTVMKSNFQPPRNKLAFQMWPDKDSLDHDGNFVNEVAPGLAEGREEGDISWAVSKSTGNAALSPAKPQTSSEVVVGFQTDQSSDSRTSDVSFNTEENTGFIFQSASSLCMTHCPTIPKSALTYVRHAFLNETIGPSIFDDKLTSQQEIVSSSPTFSFENKDPPADEQSEPPIFNLKDEVSSQKQPTASSTLFDFGNKVASQMEPCATSENGNKLPYTQLNGASSHSAAQQSVCLDIDTSSNYKSDHSCRAISSSASIPAGVTSFSSSACNQSSKNGHSSTSLSLSYSCSQPLVSVGQSSSSNIFLSATNASNTSDKHLSTSDLAPSFPAAPVFMSGFSTVLSTSVSSAPSMMGLKTYKDKIEQATTLYDSNNTHFSSTSTVTSSHNNVFSLNAVAKPSFVNDQLAAATISSATEPSTQAVPGGSGFVVDTERMSSILGSSSSLESFGLARNASLSSGSSFGCSSPAAELLFNPGSRPSEFPTVGFTSVPTTSSNNTTTVSTSNAPIMFESSTGATSSSICPITSAAAATSSQPVLRNSHPTIVFRVSSGNNDSKDQGVSKDNVHKSACTIPVFSQEKVLPPSSGFSSATSESNPFQLRSQQNLAVLPNSSPFMASGSLESNAEGSFSLGAGSDNEAHRRFVKVKRKT